MKRATILIMVLLGYGCQPATTTEPQPQEMNGFYEEHGPHYKPQKVEAPAMPQEKPPVPLLPCQEELAGAMVFRKQPCY